MPNWYTSWASTPNLPVWKINWPPLRPRPAPCKGPTLLAGDFNATSITRPYQTLARNHADCQRQLGLKPTLKTFPSGFPAIRIDHVFVSPDIKVTGVRVPFSPLSRMASDHLPLVVDFEIQPGD